MANLEGNVAGGGVEEADAELEGVVAGGGVEEVIAELEGAVAGGGVDLSKWEGGCPPSYGDVDRAMPKLVRLDP